MYCRCASWCNSCGSCARPQSTRQSSRHHANVSTHYALPCSCTRPTRQWTQKDAWKPRNAPYHSKNFLDSVYRTTDRERVKPSRLRSERSRSLNVIEMVALGQKSWKSTKFTISIWVVVDPNRVQNAVHLRSKSYVEPLSSFDATTRVDIEWNRNRSEIER